MITDNIDRVVDETPRMKELRGALEEKVAVGDRLHKELATPSCPDRESKARDFARIAEEAKRLSADMEAERNYQEASVRANRSEREPTRPGGDAPHVGAGVPLGRGRTYRDMFGEPGRSDFASFGEFMRALEGRSDPRIARRMNEGILADGGALVPTEYGGALMDLALESELVRPLATVYPMVSDKRVVPGAVLGDHSDNLFGGLVGGFVPEGGTIGESDPKYRSVNLVARKLACLCKGSIEWSQDAPDSDLTVRNLVSKGIAWFADMAYIHGDGAGGPLGIMNSPCLITVAEESSQTSYTINRTNLNKMLCRLAPGSFKTSAWVCSLTALAQILGIVENFGLENGPGSNPLFQMLPDGTFRLLTRPLYVHEACASIGEVGDIMLCDFSQYAIGMRQDVRIDSSEHVRFNTAEIMWRAILRCDGQPLWNEVLTLRDGTTTVSPFIALAQRH